MTKNERVIISLQLQMSHREMLKEFYKDRKSIEFEKAIARYTQTELLAETLCPKGKTIAEYYDWTEAVKAKNSEDVNSWWKEQQASK